MEDYNIRKNVEILAPGGSVQGVLAALNCGADAVYVGGQMFGARAYADNPDTGQLIELINEVHIRGKKLYLTVNTLLKDDEIKKQLISYLEPFYKAGLDAVIVQDFGVWSVIRKCFPEMALHASTQMTVVSPEFADILQRNGASRIVPARELSLHEIQNIKQRCDIEVETFVHGALCYCYSGQCLMSSMIGGRSGNRGRCAQPCRLPYCMECGDKKQNHSAESYMLSPKDICTLNLIPDMIDAGIDSFKIEGRMKKPEYAALVSKMYRKYADLYLNKGRSGYKVNEEDLMDLMDLYNRGGFTEGYYTQHNGRHMISLDKPNHYGTKAAVVTKVTKDKIYMEAGQRLDSQDILEISDGRKDVKPYQWTLKDGVNQKQQLCISQIRSLKIKPGMICYRTRHNVLIESIRKEESQYKNKEKIYGRLTIIKELPVKMTVKYRGLSVCVCAGKAEAALKRALTEADVRKQIEKTGNTPYVFEKLDIEMDNDVFVPLTVMNQLRRDALIGLTEKVLLSYRRDGGNNKIVTYDEINVSSESDEKTENYENAASENDGNVKHNKNNSPACHVLTGREDIFNILLDYDFVSVIYVAYDMAFKAGTEKMKRLTETAHSKHKQVYLALPHILRSDGMPDKNSIFDMAALTDGALVRNVEGLLLLKERGYKKSITADAGVYTWNQPAKGFVKSLGANRLTVPEELNYKELLLRGCKGEEIIIYGFRPLMISAQCLLKTNGGCIKEKGQSPIKPPYRLKDRTGRQMTVVPHCEGCYNLIYNSQVLDLIDEADLVQRLKPGSIRIEFTKESVKEAACVMDDVRCAVYGRGAAKHQNRDFTKGHFKRGVE